VYCIPILQNRKDLELSVLKKVWYNWPQNYYKSDWKPWYKILRGLVALPFVLFTFGLFYILVCLGYGVDVAKDIRKDIF